MSRLTSSPVNVTPCDAPRPAISHQPSSCHQFMPSIHAINSCHQFHPRARVHANAAWCAWAWARACVGGCASACRCLACCSALDDHACTVQRCVAWCCMEVHEAAWYIAHLRRATFAACCAYGPRWQGYKAWPDRVRDVRRRERVVAFGHVEPGALNVRNQLFHSRVVLQTSARPERLTHGSTPRCRLADF